MKNLYCFLKGHHYVVIKEVNLVQYPEKLVLVNGEPVVEGNIDGRIFYLEETDYSKKPYDVGIRVTLYCRKCGSTKTKEI